MTVIVITTSHSHTGIDMDVILIDYGCYLIYRHNFVQYGVALKIHLKRKIQS